MLASLISMTGHGDATGQDGDLAVAVELRSVNHRHFKLAVRGPDVTPSLESHVESLLRATIRRGSVTVVLRLNRPASVEAFRIRMPVLRGYHQQLAEEFGESQLAGVSIGALLALPGVIEESPLVSELSQREWSLVEQTLRQALESLHAMRMAEGQAMARDLELHCQQMQHDIERVAQRAPQVVETFRQRIVERVQRYLTEKELTIEPSDVVREVAIVADRCDISEELVRLRSHVHQFLASTLDRAAMGRKLDFLTQEMFRETNTIGSKANDAEISQAVVELKNRIEKMREMVQNIE